jgi:hypothetical protein
MPRLQRQLERKSSRRSFARRSDPREPKSTPISSHQNPLLKPVQSSTSGITSGLVVIEKTSTYRRPRRRVAAMSPRIADIPRPTRCLEATSVCALRAAFVPKVKTAISFTGYLEHTITSTPMSTALDATSFPITETTWVVSEVL